jgi:hypothetical protein
MTLVSIDAPSSADMRAAKARCFVILAAAFFAVWFRLDRAGGSTWGYRKPRLRRSFQKPRCARDSFAGQYGRESFLPPVRVVNHQEFRDQYAGAREAMPIYKIPTSGKFTRAGSRKIGQSVRGSFPTLQKGLARSRSGARSGAGIGLFENNQSKSNRFAATMADAGSVVVVDEKHFDSRATSPWSSSRSWSRARQKGGSARNSGYFSGYLERGLIGNPMFCRRHSRQCGSY